MSSTTHAEAVADRTADLRDVGGPPIARGRLPSIDIVRGAVMVLMALDHVRVFSGVPPGGPSPGVFFTRWFTHFCAPAFVFLAGTGAYFHLQKMGSRAAMSKFLLTRAAWLIVLELTFNRVAWTFNLDFFNYNQLNVIWAIAWGMIVLAGLIHLPVAVSAAFGLIIICGHNLFDAQVPQIQDALQSSTSAFVPLLKILYFGGEFRVGANGPHVFVLYSLVPWVGVMAAGYAFGAVMRKPPEQRRRLCLQIGFTAILAFLVLRGFNLYGNPRPWSGPGPGSRLPAPLSFLSVNKYPASLLFLLMTLGPTIALLAFLENARGRVAKWLATFGQVPLFYYLLHIPFIHVMAILVSLVRNGRVDPWLFTNHPVAPPPPPAGYTWSLALLWAVWVLVIIALYFPTRWFAALKARRKDTWLSYL